MARTKTQAAQAPADQTSAVDTTQLPPSHSPVILRDTAGEDLAGQAGCIVGYDGGAALVKLDTTGDVVTVDLSALQVLA